MGHDDLKAFSSGSLIGGLNSLGDIMGSKAEEKAEPEVDEEEEEEVEEEEEEAESKEEKNALGLDLGSLNNSLVINLPDGLAGLSDALKLGDIEAPKM